MKLRKMLSILLIVSISVVVFAGCGKSETTVSSNADKTQKLSGTLVVYSAGPDELAKNIQDGFEKKTGVKVESFQSTNGKILSRLEAEKNNPAADVVVLASLSSAQGLMKQGLTLPYKEAKNGDKLFTQWSEKDGNYFSYSLSALGIAYNTKLVKTPPTSLTDLTKEEWKDKVNIPDPSQSGSAADFVTGYISSNGEAGWNLFKDYKNNGVLMAGANQEALDPVLTGAKSIVVSGVDYMTYSAKAKGEAIDLVYPKEGTVISARPALILKSSKNVENAKAFIDYLLSDEAQKMVQEGQT
jgi:iron(III) transport system substrate-binding protein